MNATPSFDVSKILETLCRHRVRFIIVGGVCSALHGGTVLTHCLEVVPARDEDNIERLVAALDELDAAYRMQPERSLRPGRDALRGTGHHLLLTKHGPLDVLDAVGHGHTFEHLLPHTLRVDVGEGMECLMLDLPTLIGVKQETAGDKDRAALEILRRLQSERGR